MNWADIGGRTQRLHVVVKWSYGINVRILCKHHIIQHLRIKDNRQLPHCQKCITVLKKLIQESNETTQLEAKINYPGNVRVEEMQRDIRKREAERLAPK